MTYQRLFSGVTALSLLLSATPAAALTIETDVTAAVSSGSGSTHAETKANMRIERCKRFANGDDYNRCVRLINRLPQGRGDSHGDIMSDIKAEATAKTDSNWKWTNIMNRIEAKLNVAVKFVSVMAKRYCTDQTNDDNGTIRECMSRVRTELQTRVDKLIDVAFRADMTN